jgi:hypothetical protein
MVTPRQGRVERRLAAILAADADVGRYSRLKGAERRRPAAGVRGIRWQ